MLVCGIRCFKSSILHTAFQQLYVIFEIDVVSYKTFIGAYIYIFHNLQVAFSQISTRSAIVMFIDDYHLVIDHRADVGISVSGVIIVILAFFIT